MEKKIFTIQPLNEGQELNYVETLEGTLEEAQKRGIEIVKGLVPVLYFGSISVQITNSTNDDILIYNKHEHKFIKH